MEVKRILIVSTAFYPDNSPRAFRSTELAKEFARQGHNVEVLTKSRDYDYSDFKTRFSCKVTDDIIVEKYSADIFKTRRGFVRRIIDRLLYQVLMFPDIKIAFAIRALLGRSNSRYDLLLSVAKPHVVHIGCAMALTRNKFITKTWVADCGDPFTLCKSDVYKFMFHFKYLEKWMFRRASHITVPVDSARSAYYSEFSSKLKVIPQGFSFEEVKIYKGPIINPIPTFCYAGALYQNTRNPNKIMDYLGTINSDFKFIIYTSSYDVVRPYASKLHNRLEIRTPIPRDSLLFELSKMDFLLNIENIHKEQVPSKIIDYALTTRPILSIEPDNPDIENINRFLIGDYSGALVLENLNDYNISTVANRFLELLS